jgi:poly(A) polymerase
VLEQVHTRIRTDIDMDAAAKFPTDMSTKLGGRVFLPALPVVDGAPPTKVELGFNATLLVYCSDHIPQETKEGIQLRERVLNRMGALCREWIKSVCLEKGLPIEVADSAGGQLFTSGSYRLGVHEPGADIDTILVAPSVCRRVDFFGTANVTEENPQRDPSSLAERIKAHPDVTNFVPVEGAAVPLLTFDWEGINIDLLFARLSSNAVPSDFDVDNDAVLDGVDSATEKSLNGPRVTNLIASFVSGTPERYQSFLTVVRCVRKWAKARGLYSNKMGYWGGVNINIGVALTVQLYPNAPPAALLRKFFLVFKTWRWPQPLLLTKPHDAGYGLQVWGPHQSARQVAPMITPAYPAMNSTLSVSRQTLQIMQEEFSRAHQIVEKLWKGYQQADSPSDDLSLEWSALFEPSDFFISYPVCVVWLAHASFAFCLTSSTCWLLACRIWVLSNSVTFLSVLSDRHRRTLRRGLVLSSLGCESWFLICYPKVYRSKRFSCGRKR